MRNPAKFLTLKELSIYLRVHPSTIYRLLRQGELPGFKLGSDWRFSLEAINLWRQRQNGDSEQVGTNGPA